MKIIEEINNRINLLNKIKQQKEAISKGLKIEWETVSIFLIQLR